MSKEQAGPLKCVVLDFDGTLTDVEAEAVGYVAAYRDGLGGYLEGRLPSSASHVHAHDPASGAAKTAFEQGWEQAAERIRQAPSRYGWRCGPHITAGAVADPYIFTMCIAHELLDAAGAWPKSHEHEAREAFLTQLYKSSYGQAATVFRPGAKTTLTQLLGAGVPVHVVTNAHTNAVERKLGQLGLRAGRDVHVHGNARKAVLTAPTTQQVPHELFEQVPEQLQSPGFGRPVMLRRGHYFDALAEVWAAADATPETTLVVGDIFELDLALPLALGSGIHLVSRNETPRCDLEAATAASRGAVSDSLSAVLERALSWWRSAA